MRFAIVSDLHSNLQAWNATLLDIRSSRIDHIICLGDIIGYGPSPAEVLQSAHENVHSFVMGNHDAAICGKLGVDLFSDQARETLQWTRRQLGNSAIKVLSSFPLVLDGDSFLCTHGNFIRPESFDYILGPDDAEACWKSVKHQLLFAGHTHEPALYLQGPSNTPHLIAPQDFELEPGKRYLVNVGSVGCSRDNDPRASYCIFDNKAKAVYWRRIPYDLDAHRKAYEQVGRDPSASTVLQSDPRQGTTPLRKRLDFAPPNSTAKSAKNVVDVVSIRTLQRTTRRWKLISTLLITLLGIAAGAWGVWVQKNSPRPMVVRESTVYPLFAKPGSESPNLLPTPIVQKYPGQPVPGWLLAIGDTHHQSITLSPDNQGTPTFTLISQTKTEELAVWSAPIEVTPGMSFYPDVAFLRSPDFSGNAGISVTLLRNDGSSQLVQQFYTQEPGTPRSDGWARAKRKFVVPANGTRIQIKLGGRFTGTVRIKNITLGYSAKEPVNRPARQSASQPEKGGAAQKGS